MGTLLLVPWATSRLWVSQFSSVQLYIKRARYCIQGFLNLNDELMTYRLSLKKSQAKYLVRIALDNPLPSLSMWHRCHHHSSHHEHMRIVASRRVVGTDTNPNPSQCLHAGDKEDCDLFKLFHLVSSYLIWRSIRYGKNTFIVDSSHSDWFIMFPCPSKPTSCHEIIQTMFHNKSHQSQAKSPTDQNVSV